MWYNYVCLGVILLCVSRWDIIGVHIGKIWLCVYVANTNIYIYIYIYIFFFFFPQSNKKLELTEKLEKELHVKKTLNQEITSLNEIITNIRLV